MPPIGRDCSLRSLLSTAALHPSLPPSIPDSLLRPPLQSHQPPPHPVSLAQPSFTYCSCPVSFEMLLTQLIAACHSFFGLPSAAGLSLTRSIGTGFLVAGGGLSGRAKFAARDERRGGSQQGGVPCQFPKESNRCRQKRTDTVKWIDLSDVTSSLKPSPSPGETKEGK